MTGAVLILLFLLGAEIALRDGLEPFKLLAKAASGSAKLA